MGLFDWLTGNKSKVRVLPDLVWLTEQAKRDGLRRHLAQAIADPAGACGIIVVAHFADCLAWLHDMAAELNCDRLLVTLADALAGEALAALATDESQQLLIVVAERHPLPSHNESVLDFARRLPCRCQVARHISLHDPVMKLFSSDWTTNVLRRLGMKETEAIKSTMVNRRIEAALNKIAKSAIADLPANSVEEWLEKNCPKH
jgi:hypothetical protein